MQTARDIIGRSILMHPTLFREALSEQARMHSRQALLYAMPSQARSRQGAEASAKACLKAVAAIDAEDIDAIIAECGPMVISLNVAGKLQCLPRHVLTAAAVAWDEDNAN